MNTSQPQEPTRSSSPPPVRFYTLDAEKIFPGDILLSTSPTTLISRVIRVATWSDYSHAAICSESGYFIEAINVGVRRFLAHTLAAKDKANVRVLRLRSSVQDGAAIARQAGRVADRYVTHPYWKAGALTALSRMISFSESGAFFCSHLVAQAYQEAGKPLLEGRDPWKIVPGHLLTSPFLEDVTDEVLRVEDGHVRYLARDFVEGDQRHTAHHDEITIKQAIHRRTVPAFLAHGLQAPPDFDGMLQGLKQAWKGGDAKELDVHVCEALREEGLLALPEKRFPPDCPTFHQARMVAVGIAMGKWDHAAAEKLLTEFRQWQPLGFNPLQEAKSASQAFQAIAEETGSEVFAEMAAMYSSHAGRLQVIEENVSASIRMLTEYLESMG